MAPWKVILVLVYSLKFVEEFLCVGPDLGARAGANRCLHFFPILSILSNSYI